MSEKNLEMKLQLRVDGRAPAEARRAVESLEWLPAEIKPIAALVVSELVTNAVLHSGMDWSDAVALRVRRTQELLEIEVIDGGAFSASRGDIDPPTDHGREGGWGLPIVERVAADWKITAGHAWAALRISEDDG